MELGLTFPMQRFVKQKPLPCGAEQDRRYCWDLHVITLRGCKSLLAVHCYTRYTFTRFDVSPMEWDDLTSLFRAGLVESLSAAGFPEREIDTYLGRGDVPVLTRTHGRREVAFLNRAWEDVLSLDLCLDMSGQAQPLLDHEVNARPSRCVGLEGLGPASERMANTLLNLSD